MSTDHTLHQLVDGVEGGLLVSVEVWNAVRERTHDDLGFRLNGFNHEPRLGVFEDRVEVDNGFGVLVLHKGLEVFVCLLPNFHLGVEGLHCD